MSKAKTPNTTIPSEADSWRAHQQRLRAKGRGKHPLPGGRYSTLKKKLSGAVISRQAHPARHPVVLFGDDAAMLKLVATLVYYHPSGFAYSDRMMGVMKGIADQLPRADRRAIVAAYPG
jgi:hypothetical protein